jgi:hypothetical protein
MMMLYPDYGFRTLGVILKGLAWDAAMIVVVPPVALTLGVISAFVDGMPRPAGTGPKRQDEYL